MKRFILANKYDLETRMQAFFRSGNMSPLFDVPTANSPRRIIVETVRADSLLDCVRFAEEVLSWFPEATPQVRPPVREVYSICV